MVEWLDPSIKKTEWTREEEEKLLHMAKLMPAQWKNDCADCGTYGSAVFGTIRETFGQSSGERYPAERTIEKAQTGRDRSFTGDQASEPDPVDMDADELEMLSEARARLANTKVRKRNVRQERDRCWRPSDWRHFQTQRVESGRSDYGKQT